MMAQAPGPTNDRDVSELTKRRTAWFNQAGWGVMFCYLAAPIYLSGIVGEARTEQWNKQVDDFEVSSLADQVESIGAGYVLITIGQNSGFYCAPNATYDKFVGIKPSKCARRDLVADLYEALHPRGIDLVVYITSGGPESDAVAAEALEWQSGKYPEHRRPASGLDKEGRPWGAGDPRLASFQRKWEQIIREWSQRWGSKVRGWWFDGCYFAEAMYNHPTPPNLGSFAAAVRAGNPGSIIAFNPGNEQSLIDVSLSVLSDQQDYTAGEISEEFHECGCRWIHGVQWHVMSYLGESWGQGQPRFENSFVIDYTSRVLEGGGVITWDVPPQPNGLIPDQYMEQLTALGKALES